MADPLRLSPRRMLVDGLVLGGLFAVVALGSLWVDAGLWIEDYPPDIQAAAGSAGEVGDDPPAVVAAVRAVVKAVRGGGQLRESVVPK